MVGGVKALYAIVFAVSLCLPVIGADKPLTKEESAKVLETAIHESLKKPTGELTESDLEKVTRKEVEPVLKWVCVECHGPKKQKGKFRPRS